MNESRRLQRVLIMAGGTGGHVFPGLAVARCLREKGIEVHWLGTRNGIEAKVIPEDDIPIHYLDVKGLRGNGIMRLLKSPYTITKAISQATKIMKEVDPQITLGLGGYVSGPGGIASWLYGAPIIIHEQNATAGLTNKILGMFAVRILEAFPSAFSPQPKVQVIGNPVRKVIESLPPPSERFAGREQPLRLLVLGGSLGAMAINDIVPQALAKVIKEHRPVVVHQTGEKLFDETKKAYETLEVEAELHPFIKDMAATYAWADVVICRAGALTVSELCAVGLGAVFIPYPHAVDDHQTANASYMVDAQAAYCIQQKDLTADKMAKLISELAADRKLVNEMADRAYGLRKKNVQDKMVGILTEVWEGESH